MTHQELEVLARAVVRDFCGDEYWINIDTSTAEVAAFARSVANAALEDAAVELERDGDSAAAAIVREMKGE